MSHTAVSRRQDSMNTPQSVSQTHRIRRFASAHWSEPDTSLTV